MFILKYHFQFLSSKMKCIFRAGKIRIDAVPNIMEFHHPPLRLVQAFSQTLTACEIQELEDLEGKNPQQTSIWIPAVFFWDMTVT